MFTLNLTPPPPEAAGYSAEAALKRVKPLAQVLDAVSDPERLTVLQLLSAGGHLGVTQLARQRRTSAQMMGRHLKKLEQVGVLERVRPGLKPDGRTRRYQIPPSFLTHQPDGISVLDCGCLVLRMHC